MTNKYFEQLNKQKKLIEKMGHKVAYICIYGSQNYGMDVKTDDYESDLDMKAIIVPTLDNLIFNSKPISTTIDTEWGQCDLKDIREWTDNVCKGNPTYIESLFTDYYIIDEEFQENFQKILDKRDDLVYTLREQIARASYGMMCQKYSALEHPYPTIMHKIEKWGYDGKQSHHVLRLLLLINDFLFENIPYKECLSKHAFDNGQQTVWGEFLKGFKYNEYSLGIARKLTKEYLDRGQILKDKVIERMKDVKVDYTPKNDIINLGRYIIKESIENNILIDFR